MIVFDIKPSPITSFEAEIDGSTYAIKLVWSYRYSDWHMTISASDGTVLLSGIKLVQDSNLTQYSNAGLFSGRLQVLKLGTEEVIGFNSFQNKQFQLIYLADDEDFTPYLVLTGSTKVVQLGEDVNEISELPIYDPDYVSPIPAEAKDGGAATETEECLPMGIYTTGSCEPFE